MKNILIYMNIVPCGEYDIFHITEPEKWEKAINENYNRKCPNIGNKLWFQGIISEISVPENQLTYWEPSMDPDEINEKYDLIIAPMANIFSAGYSDLMSHIASTFRKFKIPIYVIACGVQADSYDNLSELCAVIREPATELIKAVYQSGGEFALRGYFTKEFFEKLGFHSAAVTGCPSLFQLGSTLGETIKNEKVKKEDFKSAINGQLDRHLFMMRKYPESEFFDQNVYYNLMNGSEIGSNDVFELCKKYGYGVVKCVAEQRVKLLPDMNSWMMYLKENAFAFSFGERIHGNVMAVLSGIPALVCACDSRTREMAEYFDIPFVLSKDKESKKDLYELYLETDYSKFKISFPEKYKQFELFLQKHDIVSKINDVNPFFDYSAVNDLFLKEDNLDRLGKELMQNEGKLKMYSMILYVYRKYKRYILGEKI